MGTPQDLFGTQRTVPESGDTDWGDNVRGILLDLMKSVDKLAQMTTADQPFLVLNTVTQTVADGATLRVEFNRHNISGAGGAVTLGALSEVIDGSGVIKDGQTLLLVGTSDSATVEMDSDEGSASWNINGDMILGDGDAIYLIWDLSSTKWLELSRNN